MFKRFLGIDFKIGGKYWDNIILSSIFFLDVEGFKIPPRFVV